ncbi:MAG: hypothetical protein IKN60_02185 [Bacteroidales bacterium]|nr:hypothetical protein [Bacteroidales bacterium]MBR3652745.1 hypothetical protein [Bacteroidales bacterium]
MVGGIAAAQTPEELYQEYVTPETQAILDRFEEAERLAQDAEEAARARKTLALTAAILIGLIPVGATVRSIIRKKSWRENPSGTRKVLGLSLLGGASLFAFNYSLFLLKIRMGNAFNTAFVFLIVAVLIAGSIYLYRKKG